jgi:hypothetical protein
MKTMKMIRKIFLFFCITELDLLLLEDKINKTLAIVIHFFGRLRKLSNKKRQVFKNCFNFSQKDEILLANPIISSCQVI